MSESGRSIERLLSYRKLEIAGSCLRRGAGGWGVEPPSCTHQLGIVEFASSTWPTTTTEKHRRFSRIPCVCPRSQGNESLAITGSYIESRRPIAAGRTKGLLEEWGVDWMAVRSFVWKISRDESMDHFVEGKRIQLLYRFLCTNDSMKVFSYDSMKCMVFCCTFGDLTIYKNIFYVWYFWRNWITESMSDWASMLPRCQLFCWVIYLHIFHLKVPWRIELDRKIVVETHIDRRLLQSKLKFGRMKLWITSCIADRCGFHRVLFTQTSFHDTLWNMYFFCGLLWNLTIFSFII